MFSRFFATFHQHLQKLACFFSFLVGAYDGLYGIASVLEFALRYPSVYLVKRLPRQPELDLSQEITVNSTVYTRLKPSSESLGRTSSKQETFLA